MCGLLLAACPGNGDDTGSGTATQTTTTSASTDPSTGAATSTSGAATSGTTGEPTTDAPTSGTGGGDAMADCEAQFLEIAKQIDIDCKCQVDAGNFPDMQACIDAAGPSPAACVCPILAGEPENGAFLACILGAEVAFTACVTPVACDDFEGYFACLDAYGQTADGCEPPDKPSYGQSQLECFEAPAFMCTSGEAVPEEFACDAEADCMDMSDEAEALCMFTCGSGEKIPKETLCDMQADCMDMSDETKEMCVFTCMNGEEIPKDYVCDGFPDCMDQSDEAMCLGRPLALRATADPGKHRARGPAATAVRRP